MNEEMNEEMNEMIERTSRADRLMQACVDRGLMVFNKTLELEAAQRGEIENVYGRVNSDNYIKVNVSWVTYWQVWVDVCCEDSVVREQLGGISEDNGASLESQLSNQVDELNKEYNSLSSKIRILKEPKKKPELVTLNGDTIILNGIEYKRAT